jgi:hypothetical protein
MNPLQHDFRQFFGKSAETSSSCRSNSRGAARNRAMPFAARSIPAAFGYIDTAEALVRLEALIRTLSAAAGLGRLEDVQRLLPTADVADRHRALALAAQLEHTEVVRLLLDAGEDPSRYNPKGTHSHSTPLHQAVWNNHMDVVKLLVERGARLDIEDTVWHGTPLGWAEHGERHEMADCLRRVQGGTV